jgi:predicted nucleic acid-binding protein
MVVDTMVLAYALIGEADLHVRATEALAGADELLAPDSLRAELVNVLWLWVRQRQVEPRAALEMLRDAEALVAEFVSAATLWEAALTLSVERDHSPYDTLFVALAAQRGTRVLTADAALLRRFPEWTVALESGETP